MFAPLTSERFEYYNSKRINNTITKGGANVDDYMIVQLFYSSKLSLCIKYALLHVCSCDL